MPQENVELTRETFERFNRGEYHALLENLFDPNVVYHVRADEPDAGVTHGHEPILQMWRTWGELFESLSAAMEEYIDRRDAVVAAGRLCGHGRESGANVREPYAWLVRWRDGRIVEVREYRTTAEALGAV